MFLNTSRVRKKTKFPSYKYRTLSKIESDIYLNNRILQID